MRPPVCALVAAGTAAAVAVPGVLVEVAEDRGGIGEVDTIDLFVVSAVLAAGAAVATATAARRALTKGHPTANVIIAAFDGIIATVCTAIVGLVAFLLLHVREEEAIGEGLGIELATWTALEFAAAGAGLVTSHAMLWWLARRG